MARLILEEGGKRRAFKLNDGKLLLGSGESCTLRLTSPNVAEIHAELEFTGDRVVLRPRPGVTPPKLGGKRVTRDVVVPPGTDLVIGGAVLRLEPDAAAATPTGAPRAGSAGGRSRAGAARTSRGRAGAAPEGSGGGAVQRTRPARQIKRGIPTWAMLAIAGGVLIVGFFVFRGFFEQMEETRWDPALSYQKAVVYVDERALARAVTELDRIDLADASPELAAKIGELRRRIADFDRQGEVDEHNRRGTEWKATQLERFVEERLTGADPPRERVRVFLKRCRQFRQIWPTHPDMDWVDRYERRYSQLVDLTQPPTFADIEYEVKTMTWAMPRDYIGAFALLASFRANASTEDSDAAFALEDKLRGEQAEYFEDRMLQAKYHWQRNEKGKSVSWLVELVIGVDDPDSVDQAAKELVNLPGIEEWLRGYQKDRPEKFTKLVKNDRVRELARSLELVL